jgi:uncharacterized protein (TIGR02265 family)
MVRSRKDVDWSRHLLDEDLTIVRNPVDLYGWYPMSTFEALGLAILDEIAKGQLEGVRMWGRFQVATATKQFPDLVARGDPRDTLMRFRVLSRAFFDYGAVDVLDVEDETAHVKIAYEMSPRAEETASTQSQGFFEGLLDAAGAKNASGRFVERSWAGDARTLLSLTWEEA